MSEHTVLTPRDDGGHGAPSTLRSVPHIASKAEWGALYARAQEILPAAFRPDGRVLNLVEGAWGHPGHGKHATSPNDGSMLGTFPMIDAETARIAVRFAAAEHVEWSHVPLSERKRYVADCVEELRDHRRLLALLLVWEIGKPYQQALTSVDRCVSGVEWYLENIDGMLAERQPLGLISNIASWNYPLSVLVHAVLVQTLAGNAVVVKTPSDGGLFALTLSFGIARRHGLPVTLVSGSGGELSDALVRNDDVACLAFVGGKTSGRDIAASLYDHRKRYMLEMEGVNAYGIWEFSSWPELARQIKKGFEFGKQRCTAYARYVIQRELFPRFLEMYLPVLASIRVGHPLLTDGDSDEPFGGIGESWKGCFVGGQYLVQAVTQGPPGERLYGNFDDYSLLPESRSR